jgi:peptide/nickel transport system permease protein
VGAFLLKKGGAALVVLIVASMLVFAGVRAIPGDTATALGADNADPAYLAAVRHEYELDKPLPVQYEHWIWRVLHGDLGRTTSRLPIGNTILQRLPLTIELSILSLLVAILIGIPAGVFAASRSGKVSDHAARFGALVGQSVPHFWLGLLLIIWFAVDLHWLPATGSASMVHHPVNNLRHLVLPVIVLATGFTAVLMRQTRSAMLTALSSDYIRTARAKGLSERRVVWHHALRNSMITVTTLLALDFGFLITGAAIAESIFGIPGFGNLSLLALNSRDYTLVQGIVLFTTLVFVLVNLLADVLYSLLDPRIRIAGVETE